MSEPILTANGLRYGHRGTARLFDGVSLDIPAGKTTVLIGPNGCGKSTLLSLLAGILTPSAGEVQLEGQSLTALRPRALARRMGILPQSPDAAEGVEVRDLVSLGRMPHRGALGPWSSEDAAALSDALAATELTEIASRPVDTLSGGQRQRAFIAMVLAQQTDVLLLDEPTSYLDVAHQLAILELLQRRKLEHSATIVMALHDIAQAARYADRLVVMAEGRIVTEGAPAAILQPDLLAQVFGIEARIFRDGPSGHLVVLPLGPSRSDVVTSATDAA